MLRVLTIMNIFLYSTPGVRDVLRQVFTPLSLSLLSPPKNTPFQNFKKTLYILRISHTSNKSYTSYTYIKTNSEKKQKKCQIPHLFLSKLKLACLLLMPFSLSHFSKFQKTLYILRISHTSYKSYTSKT